MKSKYFNILLAFRLLQEKVKCHVWDGKSGLQDNSIRQLVLTSRHVRVYYEEKKVDKKPPYMEWLLQYVRP